MKSDQEFLDGIYAKARRLQAEEEAAARSAAQRAANRGRLPSGSRRWPAPWLASRWGRWIAVAALMILVPAITLTSLYFIGVIGYRRIDNLRSITSIDFAVLATQSDLIVKGHFVGFSQGVYQESENSLYTDALFQIDEGYKGQDGGLISIRLVGGRDPVRRVYADLEISQKSTRLSRLLFLQADPAGFFRLYPNGSGCFDARSKPGTFINHDQIEITSDQIIKIIKGDD
jgi:hypothetical protein